MSVFSWLTSRLACRPASSRRSPGSLRLTVEALEDRSVPAFLPPVVSPGGATALAVGDFNNDGRADLISCDSAASLVSVRLGNGDGSFQPAQTFGTGPHPGYVVVGDFNRDGNLDAVTGNQGDHSLSLLLGNGAGGLGAAHTIAQLEGWLGSVSVGDLNRDGKLDLVAAADRPGPVGSAVPAVATLTVLLGDGQGAFAATMMTPATSGIYQHPRAQLADFNDDGRLDILSSVDHRQDFLGAVPVPPGTVVLLQLGNGNGTFASATKAAAIYNRFGLVPAVGDFDSDGRTDFYLSGAGFYLNNGTGTFRSLQVATPPPARVVADFNRDARLDVVTTNSTDGTVSLYLGNGDCTFRTTENYPAGVAPGAVAAGDWNNDGWLDLVVAVDGAAATLLNDAHGPVAVSISDVTRVEGKKNQTTLFTFTVTLSAASDQTVTMSFQTVNGTATTGNSDYTAKTGTLTFAPGETTKTITIEVKGDSKREANEYFYLDLFGLSSNALFTRSRGVGTILNDD